MYQRKEQGIADLLAEGEENETVTGRRVYENEGATGGEDVEQIEDRSFSPPPPGGEWPANLGEDEVNQIHQVDEIEDGELVDPVADEGRIWTPADGRTEVPQVFVSEYALMSLEEQQDFAREVYSRQEEGQKLPIRLFYEFINCLDFVPT
ncbi:MAG: hypothetical protein GY738_27765, partial [Pseudoalteromonas sp.]|nr:hypothetical protein [Pseudoalteromonas sp.]